MTALTLAQARTQVADHLDDPNNRRWTTTQIDVALQACVSSCVSEYASAGGTGLDEELSTTSTTAGLVTLSVIPMLVRDDLLIDTGSFFYSVKPQKWSEKIVNDSSSRTVKLRFVREFTIPSSANSTQPLIGNGATASSVWPAFERWVIAATALQLGVKDNDQRPGLQALEQMARSSVMERLNTPTTRALPIPPDTSRWGWWNSLSYIYTPSPTAPTIQLVRDSRFW